MSLAFPRFSLNCRYFIIWNRDEWAYIYVLKVYTVYYTVLYLYMTAKKTKTISEGYIMSMTQSGAQQHNAWLITLYGAKFKFVQVEIFCRGQKIKKKMKYTHTHTQKT